MDNGRHTEAPTEPLVYTVPQAAEILGLGVRTVWRMVAAGVLPVLTGVGKRRVIPRAALHHWIHTNTKGGITDVSH